ncbi:SGNH hydrolase [Setomelanomma holmii]|uniref:SGNH hydrolase n=1 Tax=Setomelanomma holmii TaxID=210430 RepID=A0A9P4H567_9PLEO|nr:SGNH hydrolase [Setomelanomma holmii]
MAANAGQRWVSGWYAPPSRMLSTGLAGRTFRQLAHVHAGGQAIRLRLSNRYGDEPVTLAGISVANSVQGPMVGKKSARLTFAEHTDVVLEPGAEKISGPVSMHVEPFNVLTISFELVKGDALTGHLFASQTSYISSTAAATPVPAELAFVEYPLMRNSCWLITGLDVMLWTPLNAVVAFGSSTTDGLGSTPNTNGRWPDYLAHRLKEAGGTQYMVVINAGLSGNQLTTSENDSLSQLPGANMPKFMFGEAGLHRYDWDLASQPGATDLILHIGSNDLRAGVKAVAIIEGYKQLVQTARKVYQKVFGTTILPGGYTLEQSAQRQIVNDWILEHGSRVFDAVFDVGTPLRAEMDTTKLDPAYDSGDGIHPNNDEYRLMADAIDIAKLSGSPLEGN